MLAAALMALREDSPHTRGWTLQRRPPHQAGPGFPAHAGMDPDRKDDDRLRPGIPRTRGDGPDAEGRRRWLYTDSPHTRGWTPHRRRHPRMHRGFPAHAGMDPCPPRPPAGCAWIPRTRGDGPKRHIRITAVAQDSPHTRGWTHDATARYSAMCGFPAHAGMDPSSSAPRDPSCGIPRTRGDGPLSRAELTDIGGGFPAHAGMDPRPARAAKTISRIPRTRGDGPWTRSPSRSSRTDSPHTRGWTPTARMGAHAQDGFPRTRGDGPYETIMAHLVRADSPHTRGWTWEMKGGWRAYAGFPAHAGMDPLRLRHVSRHHGIPRTRGAGMDRWLDRSNVGYPEDSPHTRGWTSSSPARMAAASGFPAHAGMDP